MYVGKDAFEYLAGFNGEIEYESVTFGGGSLIYGSIGNGMGSMQPVEPYGEFTAPP
jgi:hypothetical protein